MAKPLAAIILAAGEGTRMKSLMPKVLHSLGGKPMLDYVLDGARKAGASKVYLVVGAQAEKVKAYAGKRAVAVVQRKRRGTGHAVRQVLPHLKSFSGDILVLYGDSALLRTQTLMDLVRFHRRHGGAATLLTARVPDPFGYGRIVRDREGRVEKIVEEKDADEKIRGLREINGGAYIFKAPYLRETLRKLKPQNAKGEYYLTDVAGGLVAMGQKAQAFIVADAGEILGVNDRAQLALAHRVLTQRRVEAHQKNGVTFVNPETVEIGDEVRIAGDSVIEGGVHLEGATVVGEGCRLEAGSRLANARLGKNVMVKSSRISDSRVDDGSDVGPQAHVRGGCRIGPHTHIGTQAELKNVKTLADVKVGHFSYVGDATLGRGVNVGAGCVFANFDGRAKHSTRVGDRVFLGSNSTLVAPLRIGAGAVVAAGAVVTKNVSPKTLVMGVPARPRAKSR